jgi:malate dehydrogenase
VRWSQQARSTDPGDMRALAGGSLSEDPACLDLRTPSTYTRMEDEMHENLRVDGIVVAGAGSIGAATAGLLAERKLARRIVLLDRNEGRARRAAVDIRQKLGQSGDLPLKASASWADVVGADIVVVASSRVPSTGYDSWDRLLAADPRSVEATARELGSHAPGAVVIVAAGPVESVTRLVQQATGFLPHRVLGIGGLLYSARFRRAIAEEKHVAAPGVAAIALGGGNGAVVPLVSQATVGGEPLSAVLEPEQVAEIVARTRRDGAAPADLRDTTEANPAYAAVRIVEAVVNNEHALLPCTVRSAGQLGTVDGGWLALPTFVGREGVMGIDPYELNPVEQQQLRNASTWLAPSATEAEE